MIWMLILHLIGMVDWYGWCGWLRGMVDLNDDLDGECDGD